MSGKKTNTIIALTNIFLGIIFIIFNYIYTSNEAEFTRYDIEIFTYLKIGLFSLVVIINSLNLVYSIISIWAGRRFMLYLLSLFSLLVFIPVPNHINYIFPAFLVVSGIIILIKTRKNNYIEKDSFWAITVNIMLMLLMAVNLLGVVLYKQIGEVIKTREEVDLVKYDSKFFQFITPLADSEEKYKDVFINIKKDGKYGYITPKGEKVIEFKYDFATPYYTVKSYDKTFYVAAVSEGNLSRVIMKNGREAMTYNSEYTPTNPEMKIKEFERVLKEKMMQKEEDVSTEKSEFYLNLEPRRVYDEEPTDEYTYRFDFNDKYDIYVLESYMGNPTKYSIGRKDSESTPKELNIEHLIYDSENLYVFSSGDLPFFSPSKNQQGWITKSGKKLNLEGNAEILDVKDDYILINNLSKNKMYFVDKELNQISKYYKEVIKYKKNYVARKDDGVGKWVILNDKLEQLFKEEYDVFSPILLSEGLYIFANIEKSPRFNDQGYIELKYIIITEDFKVLYTDIENVYNLNARLLDRTDPEKMIEFIEKLRMSNTKYFSDKFYNKEKNDNDSFVTQRPEKSREEQDDDTVPDASILNKAFAEQNN